MVQWEQLFLFDLIKCYLNFSNFDISGMVQGERLPLWERAGEVTQELLSFSFRLAPSFFACDFDLLDLCDFFVGFVCFF